VSTGYIGYGHSFSYSVDDGATWTDFGQVVDVDGVHSGSVPKVDITNTDSASATREYVPGLFDGTNPTFKVIHTSDLLQEISALHVARTLLRFRVILSSGFESYFDGWIMEVRTTSPLADRVMSDITIAITGVLSQIA
jgi:predicted RNA-binding protein with TRAM domain